MEIQVELVNPFRNISVDPRRFDIDLLQWVVSVVGVAISLALRQAEDAI